MDLYKLAQHIGEILQDGHWHLPLFAGLLGAIKNHNSVVDEKTGGLGNVPGDNILPKEILISFCARKKLER